MPEKKIIITEYTAPNRAKTKVIYKNFSRKQLYLCSSAMETVWRGDPE